MNQTNLKFWCNLNYLIVIGSLSIFSLWTMQRVAYAEPTNEFGRAPNVVTEAPVETLSVGVASPIGVADVEQAPGSSGSTPESSLWELYSQLEMLQEEMQQLRGVIENQRHHIESLTRKQKEHYIDLDHRIGLLNKTVSSGGTASVRSNNSYEMTPSGVVVPPLNTSDSSTVARRSAPMVPTEDEKNRYNSAIALVRAKKLNQSEEAFRLYLNDYPNSIYTANAHYWLGEIYLALPSVDYDKARMHFETVTTQYPKHSKASACLYKLGVLHHRQGDVEKAKSLFHRVINSYPESSAAGLAQKSLNRISPP